MDCIVGLTTERSTRYIKVLRAKEPVPVSPGPDKGGKPLPAPLEKTDAELIQKDLFSYVSGTVLYQEKQNAKDSVKDF